MNSQSQEKFTLSKAMRRPAWRYFMAKESVRNGQVLLRRRADATTRSLARYLRKESECTNRAARARLRVRYPAIAMALVIYRDPIGACRCLLEALVLARESTATIAERCDVSQLVVQWYRRCFFSVGDRLNDKAYIVASAIQPELRNDDHDADRRFVMKLISYFCGAPALDLFFFSGEVSARALWQKPEAFIDEIAFGIDFERAVGMAMSPEDVARGDPERVRQWLEEVVKRVRARRSESWPTNYMERSVASILGFTGGNEGEPDDLKEEALS